MSTPRVQIVSLLVRISCFLWCTSLSIRLSYKLYQHKKSKRSISRKTIIPSLTNFIGWSIAYGITSLHYLLLFLNPSNPTIPNFITYLIFTISYPIAFTASYIFVVSLLYESFNGSEFAMSKCTITYHIITSILLFISCTAATFFAYIMTNFSIGGMITFLNAIFYIIGLLILIFQLNTKLVKMIILINESSKLNVLSKVQQTFLMTVTKLSVLISTFGTTTFLWIIITIIRHVLWDVEIMQIADWIGYGLAIINGTSCIYLTFTFNKKEYKKICGKCNDSCYKCCIFCVHTVNGTPIRETLKRRNSLTVSVHSHTGTQSDKKERTRSKSEASLPPPSKFQETKMRVQSYSDYPTALKRDGVGNTSNPSVFSHSSMDVKSQSQPHTEINIEDLGDITDLAPIQKLHSTLSTETIPENEPKVVGCISIELGVCVSDGEDLKLPAGNPDITPANSSEDVGGYVDDGHYDSAHSAEIRQLSPIAERVDDGKDGDDKFKYPGETKLGVKKSGSFHERMVTPLHQHGNNRVSVSLDKIIDVDGLLNDMRESMVDTVIGGGNGKGEENGCTMKNGIYSD